MLKGIKLRLYPNQTQQDQLWQMFGNDRFVWNKMLAMMNERYQNNKELPFLSKFKLNYLLKPLKKEYPFLKNSDSSSLQVEAKPAEQFRQTGKQIGIDVGVADLATLSNGLKYLSFDGSYYEKKTVNWQKKYSRRRYLAQMLCLQDKQRKTLSPRSLDSFSNWKKAQRTKAVCQAKVAAQRKDYLHKLTTHLVKQYDVIVIEDLKVKNLQKNHHLAKSIANASWSMFRQMMEYKCQWYDKKLIAVDPKNTSRICSKCGYNSGEKPLDIREWSCPNCQTHHDRDINAAVNILNKAKPAL
ncbi:transposase [Lactobacillus acidophilus]|uniref:transposase n=1 Tax=Lactobacillus acidophilus TaxID=1579 RepID=UPI0021A6626C|nr:transposase [Lactobacillus acidophilus]MCT3620730.1 transposase [Lactobacillus acidophilus]